MEPARSAARRRPRRPGSPADCRANGRCRRRCRRRRRSSSCAASSCRRRPSIAASLSRNFAEIRHVVLVDLGDLLEVFLVALMMRQVVVPARDADLRERAGCCRRGPGSASRSASNRSETPARSCRTSPACALRTAPARPPACRTFGLGSSPNCSTGRSAASISRTLVRYSSSLRPSCASELVAPASGHRRGRNRGSIARAAAGARKFLRRSSGEPAPNSRSNTSRGFGSGGIGVVADRHEMLY